MESLVFLYFFLFHDFRPAVLKSRILLLSCVLLASLAPHITTGRPAGKATYIICLISEPFCLKYHQKAAMRTLQPSVFVRTNDIRIRIVRQIAVCYRLSVSVQYLQCKSDGLLCFTGRQQPHQRRQQKQAVGGTPCGNTRDASNTVNASNKRATMTVGTQETAKMLTTTGTSEATGAPTARMPLGMANNRRVT